MTKRPMAPLLVLVAAGCTSTPPPGEPVELAPPRAEMGTPAPVEETSSTPHAGEVMVSVVGTPFLLAFKTVVCAGSLVVAGPAAAIAALADGPGSEGVEILGDGVAQNCGPPYILTPRGV